MEGTVGKSAPMSQGKEFKNQSGHRLTPWLTERGKTGKVLKAGGGLVGLFPLCPLCECLPLAVIPSTLPQI